MTLTNSGSTQSSRLAGPKWFAAWIMKTASSVILQSRTRSVPAD